MKTRLISGLAAAGTALTLFALPAFSQETPPQGQQPNETSGTQQAAEQKSVPAEQDRKFVLKAAREGMKEVALAQLAVSKAERPEVRELASQLVRDHTSSNRELMSIAQVEGIPVPRNNPGPKGAEVEPAEAGASRVDPGDSSAPPANAQSGAAQTAPAPAQDTPAQDAATRNAEENAGNPARAREHQEELRKLQDQSGVEFDEAFLKKMEECRVKDIETFERAKTEVNSPRLKGFIEKTLPVLRAHASRIETLRNPQSPARPTE